MRKLEPEVVEGRIAIKCFAKDMGCEVYNSSFFVVCILVGWTLKVAPLSGRRSSRWDEIGC